MAPLFTFALQAATYQAGMPTHNYNNKQQIQRKTLKIQNFLYHRKTFRLLSMVTSTMSRNIKDIFIITIKQQLSSISRFIMYSTK